MHVHVQSSKGEAKYWLQPELTLVKNTGFAPRDLQTIVSIIEEHEDEIRGAWDKHFKS